MCKKILFDIISNIKGSNVFQSSNYRKDKLLYPLDLEFTFDDIKFHYEPFDSCGIPCYQYKSVGVQYNPTRIAAYGLAHFNRFRQTKNLDSYNKFILAANWFLNVKNGLYYYDFDWEEIKAPWISCNGQGEAASVLIRAYILTENKDYLQKATQALAPFKKNIQNGGLRSYIGTSEFPYLEEYPSPKQQSSVLNGCLYAIVGIIEVAEILPEIAKEFELSKLLNTLVVKSNNWCCGFWSLYEIKRNKFFGYNFCTPNYHNLHITLYRFIGYKTGADHFSKQADIWQKGADSFFIRCYALMGKVLFRISNKAQR